MIYSTIHGEQIIEMQEARKNGAYKSFQIHMHLHIGNEVNSSRTLSKRAARFVCIQSLKCMRTKLILYAYKLPIVCIQNFPHFASNFHSSPCTFHKIPITIAFYRIYFTL